MSTLKVINSIHPSGSTNNLVFDNAGNTTAGGTLAMSSSFLRNRIINGAQTIDQRNAGAAVTVNNTGLYITDRFIVEDGTTTGVLSAQQVTDAPTGYTNSLKVTATTGTGAVGASEYSVITQIIEGYNIYDFSWGSASAVSVTVSFWVKATTTGTYSLTLYNNGATRINPQPFTINASNTWEYKTVSIVGDTTGTWLTNNGRGVVVNFYTTIGTTYQSSAGWNGSSKYGVTGSTNAFVTTGNTFAITGVQLEVGSVATPFERRLYGQELYFCQRYLQRLSPTASSTNPFLATASMFNSTVIFPSGQFTQPMRAVPTLILEGAVSNYAFFVMSAGTYLTATGLTLNAVTTNTFFFIQGTVTTGATAGQISYLAGNSQNTLGIQFSAEL